MTCQFRPILLTVPAANPHFRLLWGPFPRELPSVASRWLAIGTMLFYVKLLFRGDLLPCIMDRPYQMSSFAARVYPSWARKTRHVYSDGYFLLAEPWSDWV